MGMMLRKHLATLPVTAGRVVEVKQTEKSVKAETPKAAKKPKTKPENN